MARIGSRIRSRPARHSLGISHTLHVCNKPLCKVFCLAVASIAPFAVDMTMSKFRLVCCLRLSSAARHFFGLCVRYDIKGSTRNRISDPHDSVGKDVNFDEDPVFVCGRGGSLTRPRCPSSLGRKWGLPWTFRAPSEPRLAYEGIMVGS